MGITIRRKLSCLLSALKMEAAGPAKPHGRTSQKTNLPVLVPSVRFKLYISLCLSQLSKRQNLARARWLLFLTEGNTDSFFADITVPFNCEFLIARLTTSSVSLFEVYRVANSKPLNDIYFGRWTVVSGLVTLKTSIYSRRTDLQGTVIRAVTADVSAYSPGVKCIFDLREQKRLYFLYFSTD
jgi:hypothetical protein